MLGRAWNREHGYLQKIEPGEVRTFNMEIGILDGAPEIRAFEQQIKEGLKRKSRKSSSRR
tara:strand:- start:1073 stop:1252 length:180 start_codon:yes stop_codon:yes gene_type:complete